MKIHSGDQVQVMSGKDKGKQGKVIRAFLAEQKVLIEGVNIATRHIKKQGNTPGQIVKSEKPVHVATVALLDPEKKIPTRVGYRMEWTKKVRYAKKSGKTL